MNEKLLREAVRSALKEITGEEASKTSTQKRETFLPQDREHLAENKDKLNKELMRRWGFKKQK